MSALLTQQASVAAAAERDRWKGSSIKNIFFLLRYKSTTQHTFQVQMVKFLSRKKCIRTTSIYTHLPIVNDLLSAWWHPNKELVLKKKFFLLFSHFTSLSLTKEGFLLLVSWKEEKIDKKTFTTVLLLPFFSFLITLAVSFSFSIVYFQGSYSFEKVWKVNNGHERSD